MAGVIATILPRARHLQRALDLSALAFEDGGERVDEAAVGRFVYQGRGGEH